MPRLSLTGLTGLNGAPATSRADTRITASYTWSHATPKHGFRMGSDVRFDRDSSQLNVNAPGMFTFTGLSSTGGRPISLANGPNAASNAAFADFLLGLPQQATLQVGGTTQLRGKSFDAYVEDNWQKNSKLTFNLGLRYELVGRTPKLNGHLANLDATSGFTAVAPVLAGGSGLFSGVFPSGLINARYEQLRPPSRPGVPANARHDRSRRLQHHLQPRLVREHRATARVAAGAWLRRHRNGHRLARRSTGHSGCVARLVVARHNHEQLGRRQGLRARDDPDLERIGEPRRDAELDDAAAGYTGTKGTNLDICARPNRGPDGSLLIPGVQPFIWESSAGTRS